MDDATSQDDRPVLEYDHGVGRDPWWRRGWLIAPLIGALAGSLLGYGAGDFVCGAPLFACVVGAATALLVRRGKWAFALVAALAIVMACIGVEVLRSLPNGWLLTSRGVLRLSLVHLLTVIMPTLFGAFLVIFIDEATRPGPRE